MTIQTWLLFCVTETVLCFTPGPAVLLVVSLGLTTGARAGLGASLGILTANAFYFVLSATGIGAMLLASYDLFFLIKWIGAAYLVWLGVRMLLSRANAIEPAPTAVPRRTLRVCEKVDLRPPTSDFRVPNSWAFAEARGPMSEAQPRRSQTLRPFTHGVVTQGANPKALVFFTALLPQFIHPESAVPYQVAILAASSILIELVVLSIYVTVCHRARGMMRRPGFATALNRAGGVLLIGAGAGMATMRRA